MTTFPLDSSFSIPLWFFYLLPSVRALEVAAHNFIEPTVTEYERLELEAACSQQVNCLLVLVRKPEPKKVWWVGLETLETFLNLKCMTTLQRNLDLCIPRKGIARPSPNFHIHVSVTDLYVQSTYFPASRIGRPIKGIYKSLTETWM